jgi:hypothetical protein
MHSQKILGAGSPAIFIARFSWKQSTFKWIYSTLAVNITIAIATLLER